MIRRLGRISPGALNKRDLETSALPIKDPYKKFAGGNITSNAKPIGIPTCPTRGNNRSKDCWVIDLATCERLSNFVAAADMDAHAAPVPYDAIASKGQPTTLNWLPSTRQNVGGSRVVSQRQCIAGVRG